MLHLLRTPSLICAFIGAPLMMMYNGAVMNWLPSYLIREGGLDAGKSSNIAAIIMLSQVVGAGCVGPGHRFSAASVQKCGSACTEQGPLLWLLSSC